MHRPKVYLATVCLERNRWGSRSPSFCVSDWLSQFSTDGFDGIELWENHYFGADEDEQAKLRDARGFISVFNTYVGFTNAAEEVARRRKVAELIGQLAAPAVKYNLGADPACLGDYRRELLSWSRLLPDTCSMLCECHPGTVLESSDRAAAFFADLDPGRFGVIAHAKGDAASLQQWLLAFGPRVRHLHLQFREPEDAMVQGRSRLAPCVEVLRRHHYEGTASIEFTRGIGRTEQIEAIYAAAVEDAQSYRRAWN
jgi:sugar phosphate isomerase/epimerase